VQLARSKCVDELADPGQRQAGLEEARWAAEQRLAAECTFKPDTCKPLIPDVEYSHAKAAFCVHSHEPEELVQRCGTFLWLS
jgi:hypothetical protein